MILKTQLIPPKLKKNLLRRERLLKILHQNLDKKLIIITAGAGYGKTTLLSQLINEIKAQIVFYSIRKEDNNLITFISYLITGVQEIYKEFGIRVKTTMEIMGDNINLEVLMRTFVNELIDTTKKEVMFIILDDYHWIDEVVPINKALEYLIEYLPYNVHIVISSRSKIPFPITKLLAKDEVLEISNEDLKFTTDETQKLFREIYKLNISDSQLEVIERCFAGWVTALQLTAYLVEKAHKDALDRIEYGKENIDYFANEVFDLQSKEVQAFLVKSCIMEQMTPEVCNVVLGINNSRKILNELMDKNLFISCIDEKKGIFAYHYLFRNFLLNILYREIDEKSIKELHSRAGEYFKNIKDYTNSINHYILAKEVHKAVKIVEREGKKKISFTTLEQWLKKLPNSVIQKRPLLLLFLGYVYLQKVRLDQAIKVYRKAKTKSMKDGYQRGVINAMRRIAEILYLKGKYKEAIMIGKRALDMVGKQEDLLKVDLLIYTAYAYDELSYRLKAISITSEALRICRKIRAREQEVYIRSIVLGYYLELGELDKVIEDGEQLIKESKEEYFDYLPAAYLFTGIAYMFKEEFDNAKDYIKKTLQISKKFNFIINVNVVFETLAYLNVMLGNYALARRYGRKVLKFCDEFGIKESVLAIETLRVIAESYLLEGELPKAEEYINKITSIREKSLITKGEIKIGLGKLDEAEATLKLALKHIRRSQSRSHFMLVHAAFSKLYYKKLDEKSLINHLKQTLALSSTHNYHPLLIRLGKINFPLLQFAVRKGIEPYYAEYLLKEFYVQYDLVVRFFGGLEIYSKDRKLGDKEWRTHRAKLLFCYLVMNRNKKATRDQLIETLWPGAVISKARGNLHYNLSCIRDVFSIFVRKDIPFVEYKDEAYQLNPGYKIWTDVGEFEHLIRGAENITEPISISNYESAINLYRDDFLPEMYDDWSEELRLSYKEQYLKALDRVANFYMSEHKFDKVIEYCKKIITMDEFNEPAYYMAVKSYLLKGNRKSALNLYKQLERDLKKELNLKPSPEIESLFTFFSP